MTAASADFEDTASDLLSAVEHEELLACARLLALSVAHHRAKFGVVPMSVTAAEHGGRHHTPRAVRSTGKAVLEALDVVRREAEGASVTEADLEALSSTLSRIAADEKRGQLRISVNAKVRLSDIDGAHVRDATLRNISWGGAAVRCTAPDLAVGARLCLLLPAGRGRTIRIEATVLRSSLFEGHQEFGLRFDSLDPDDEDRLQQVLKLLMSEPDHEHRRSEVRLVQRLEVEYGDAGEFRATLEDLSASGMMLTVPNPVEIGQSLLVSLSSVDTPFGLNLRARVVHQALIEGLDIDMYRVGLQFEHPTPRLRERIEAIVNELAVMRVGETMAHDVQSAPRDWPGEAPAAP